jgi:two-component system, OmpR family, response regulator
MIQVLYVDDEPDIREVAAMALQLDPAIKVHAVESGAAALALLEGGAFSPDVALLDVMMPAMDGPGLLMELRARPRTAATPVIFMTARTQAHDRHRLLELGALGVIDKPFDPMSLARELRALLATERAA